MAPNFKSALRSPRGSLSPATLAGEGISEDSVLGGSVSGTWGRGGPVGTEAATAGGDFRNHQGKHHCFTDNASHYLVPVPPAR